MPSTTTTVLMMFILMPKTWKTVVKKLTIQAPQARMTKISKTIGEIMLSSMEAASSTTTSTLLTPVAATTARGVHAAAAVLLLGLLSLALARGVLARGLAVVDGRRALAATTAAGRLLGLGRLGLAAALSAATTLALALTGTSIGFGIATTALGHRRAGQTVGTRQAIAHVDAVLAI